MPACSIETHAALGTIGLEAAHGLTRQTIRAGIDQRLVAHPEGTSEVYRSAEPGFMEAFPRGLTIMEALGYTVVLDWAAGPPGGGLVVRVDHWRPLGPDARWAVRLPAIAAPTREMEPQFALELARALLHIRRIVWPSIPWRLRDSVAEHLERHVRLIEASMRPPQRPEVITPYCAPSDLGRDWSR